MNFWLYTWWPWEIENLQVDFISCRHILKNIKLWPIWRHTINKRRIFDRCLAKQTTTKYNRTAINVIQIMMKYCRSKKTVLSLLQLSTLPLQALTLYRSIKLACLFLHSYFLLQGKYKLARQINPYITNIKPSRKVVKNRFAWEYRFYSRQHMYRRLEHACAFSSK